MEEQKYINVRGVGFITWPVGTGQLWHSTIGSLFDRRDIISAGMFTIQAGIVTCYGRSESLNINSKSGDSAALAEQLGLKAA